MLHNELIAINTDTVVIIRNQEHTITSNLHEQYECQSEDLCYPVAEPGEALTEFCLHQMSKLPALQRYGRKRKFQQFHTIRFSSHFLT